ncbi:MAG: DUF6448 family protein [Melioribacter sp.]|uniref:DUF6448 family protein n=1 Tax=Rosettibacter primus TaxID=3111523 RepID=UPI00247D44FE|nr:DUF6448 family protein [Melioribacter sp.]
MTSKLKFSAVLFLASFIFIFISTASAHCDSMEGPVVKAAKKSLETGNINYVLIWVRAEDEPEIKAMFDKVIKVRTLSSEAKELADMYFFETVVRVHRMGEDEPYTGLKSAGYLPAEGIEAADIAIEKGTVENILSHLDKNYHSKVKELFNNLQSKKNYDVNDVKSGREFVAAYVHFIHYVENIFNDKEVNDLHNNHKH